MFGRLQGGEWGMVMFLTLVLAGLTPLFQASAQQTVADSTPAAGNAELVTVEVAGVGIDAASALKDAWRKAVWQVVGSFVSAETLVKNDKIVKDEILTSSNGIIVETKTLSEGRRPDGLYVISIHAVVQKTQLIAKLEAAKVTESATDTLSPAAKIRTEEEKAKAAAALLETALEGLPCSLLEARLAEDTPEVTKNGSQMSATWKVAVSVKQDEYYKIVVPKLRQVFDQIADIRYEGEPGKSSQEPRDDVAGIHNRLIEPFAWNFQSSFESSYKKYKSGRILLNVGCETNGTTEQWIWYVLKDTLVNILERKFDPENIFLHTEFHDDGGGFLGEAKPFDLFRRPFLLSNNYIAPRAMISTANGKNRAGTSAVFSVQKEFTEEDLLKVKKVVCYVSAK